jgi:Na+/H+-dicarboxylate symporter
MQSLNMNSQNKSNDLYFLILSIFLGAFVGFYFPHFMNNLEWVGKVFMNYLMLLILPLIFFALVQAITSIGNLNQLSKLGKYSFFIIFLNVSLASAIGILFALFFHPGQNVHPELLLGATKSTEMLSEQSISFTSFITGIFPSNLASAAVKSEILPIVIFSLFFSIVCLKNNQKESVQIAIKFFQGIKEILLNMLSIVMKITPLAMFSLIGNAISHSILNGHFSEDFKGILGFSSLFIAGSVFLCFVQFLILFVLIGKKSLPFFKNSLKSSSTGFATSSSMATLPVMLLYSNELEIDDSIAKFTLPLTVVFNLGSSALYVACATLFICQGLNYPLTTGHIIVIYLTTILTGMGTTGIPNAGFIATMTVLKTIALPTSAVAILFPIDAVLSRIRTSVNVWGHLVCVKCISLILEKKK